VVVGYTPGEGERYGMIGSLLLAVGSEDVAFEFVGRVGTGMTDALWRDLQVSLPETAEGDKLRWLDLSRATKPELRDVTFVEPTTVVQVAFQRWTQDGRLWHPSVKGVRDDKDASEVVREP
jgi:bifunctional non-homologous end joining protein LigD